MKSDQEAIQTFATFRVSGDSLDPAKVTEVLKFRPTVAYAKGETYLAPRSSKKLVGRTGVWYFSTKNVIASYDLSIDHLALIGLVVGIPTIMNFNSRPEKFYRLKDLIALNHWKGLVTFFWSGPSDFKYPYISDDFVKWMKLLPAEIERDFENDQEPPHNEPRLAHA